MFSGHMDVRHVLIFLFIGLPIGVLAGWLTAIIVPEVVKTVVPEIMKAVVGS